MAFALPWARPHRLLPVLCPALAAGPVVLLRPRRAVLPRVAARSELPRDAAIRAWVLSAGEWRNGSADDLPAPSHAVIVHWRSPQEGLNEAEREAMWRQFGVPVFEQWWSASGQVLATECEAHAGMHVLQPRALERAAAGEWASVEEPCPCAVAAPLLALASPATTGLRATIILGAAPSAR